jgi:outer membrane protein assembly factor BamB
MNRNTNKVTFLRMAWFVGILLLLNTVTVQATTPPCGTTLTADTTLDANMDCSSTAIKFSDAGSNNFELDCAGHSIVVSSGYGILASNVSGISIQNCTIETSGNFKPGILLQQGVSNSSITTNIISTSGMLARGIDIQQSTDIDISNNIIETVGNNANALRLRSGANDNRVSDNLLVAEAATLVNIESSSNIDLNDNLMTSSQGFLITQKLLLEGGGLGVNSAGTIYAVENSRGSSSGLGVVTTFFQVDPASGMIHTPIALMAGAVNLGFGFEALDILPNGRILALPDSGGPMALYEIDPISGQVTSMKLNLPALALTGTLNGLEALDNSSLLATTDAGELLTIDIGTGDVTPIGQQAIGWKDLARDPTTAKIYAMSKPDSEATDTNHLYEIDAATGKVMVEVGDLNLDLGHRFASDLDFASDGTLYSNNGGQLIVIDPATGSVIRMNRFGPDPLESLSRNVTIDNNQFNFDQGFLQFTDPITLPDTIEQIHLSNRISRLRPQPGQG